jgi:hypothetical protein
MDRRGDRPDRRRLCRWDNADPDAKRVGDGVSALNPVTHARSSRRPYRIQLAYRLRSHLQHHDDRAWWH